MPFDGASRRSQPSLPPTWRWVRLGDVCEETAGVRDPRSEPEKSFRYVDITSVDNSAKRIVDPRTLLGGDAPSRARQVIRAGDVIVSTTRPNLNAVAMVPQDLDGQVCSTGFCVLRAKEGLEPAYLFAFVRTAEFVQSLSNLVKGALYPAVTDKQVRDQVMPLPPLPEQERIAAILNEQMAAVEKARAAAEPRLEAAKGLLAAYLRATFDSQEIRRWPSESLGNVLQLRKEIVHPRDNPQGPATFVGLEHVESITGRRIGSIDLEKAALTGRKPQFYTGDIVYGYLRPYLNKVWIGEFDGLCSVDQYVYSVDRDKAITEFVAWFMRSPGYLRSAPIDTTPGQLPRIRTEEVSSVEIHLPPLAEQERIVRTLKAQVDAAERVRKGVAEELAAIGALPAVLLKGAFSGEL